MTTSPAAALLDLNASYEQYYETGLYRRRYPRPNNTVLDLIQRNIRAVGGRVLDFGCGNGRYAAPLLERTNATILGYDISQAALDELGEPCAPFITAGRLRLVQGGLANLAAAGEAGEKLDLALMMFCVLGHISGRAQRIETLRTVRGMLRPGGRLIATVPSAWRRFRREQAESQPLVAAGRIEPGDILYCRRAEGRAIDLYYHLYSVEEFAREIRDAGFEVIDMRPESMLPERGVINSRLLGSLDRCLTAMLPVRWAYGFLVVAGTP